MMQYISKYNSPLGELLIISNENKLTGICLNSQEYYDIYGKPKEKENENEIIKKTKKWLDIYFSGKNPEFEIPIYFKGTAFQDEVWKILCTIPYGQTMTYGEIAKIIAQKRGIKRMSAQAVGGAVGKNNIPIIIPCHRVIGSDGSLTGFTGGIDKKIKLLKVEKIID